jgi:hypothetical protein
MIGLQYIKMLWLIYTANPLLAAIKSNIFETQLAFHILYVCMAVRNVRIVRPAAYLAISAKTYVGLAFYHSIALAFTQSGSVVASYFMAYYTHLFWALHCDTLSKSNMELMRDIS